MRGDVDGVCGGVVLVGSLWCRFNVDGRIVVVEVMEGGCAGG